MFDRRRFLVVAGGAVAALATGSPAAALAAPTSANGWPIDPKVITAHVVQGSDASVALRTGDVATVLLHAARRFHYEIHALEPGELTGTVGTAPFETNYLSGTAFAIGEDRCPAGARGCLFPHEVAVVRDVLAECDGVLRWGGDDLKAPKEGHFQIDVRPGDPALARVARKISGWDASPGKGAGTF